MDSEEFEGALDAVKQGENGVIVGAIIVGHLGDFDIRGIHSEKMATYCKENTDSTEDNLSR